MVRNTHVTPARSVPALPQADDGAPNALEFMDGAELELDIKRVSAELGESDTEAKVQIWRIRKGERRPAFVATIPPQSFSMEKIAEEFGGGIYNIKVFVPKFDADGKRMGVMMAKNPVIEIDGPPKEPKRPDPPAVVEAKSTSDIVILANAIASGFEKMGTLIVANQKPPQSIADAVRDLAALQAFTAGLNPRANEKAPDPFAMFERFMTMQDKMTSAVDRLPGNANNNQMLLALGRDFISMFKKATVPEGDAAALPAPGPAAPDGAAPGSGSGEPPAAAAPIEDDPMNIIIKGQVALLVNHARANNDVTAIAQEIYDRAPDEFLRELMSNDKYLDLLATINPNVKLYPAWFDRLRARIKEIYDADQQTG